MKAGSENAFSYRLTWSQEKSYGDKLAVLNTRIGSGFDGRGMVAVIDFDAGPTLPEDFSAIAHPIRSSAGTVSSGVLQRNPETGGPRLAFTFEPEDAELIEFRAQLLLDGAPISEVWLYRWTA